MKNEIFANLVNALFAVCLLGGVYASSRVSPPASTRLPNKAALTARQYCPENDNLQIKLNSHPALRGAHITIEFVSKDEMVMRGTVLSTLQKRRASEIARKLDATPVINELRIQTRK